MCDRTRPVLRTVRSSPCEALHGRQYICGPSVSSEQDSSARRCFQKELRDADALTQANPDRCYSSIPPRRRCSKRRCRRRRQCRGGQRGCRGSSGRRGGHQRSVSGRRKRCGCTEFRGRLFRPQRRVGHRGAINPRQQRRGWVRHRFKSWRIGSPHGIDRPRHPRAGNCELIGPRRHRPRNSRIVRSDNPRQDRRRKRWPD